MVQGNNEEFPDVQYGFMKYERKEPYLVSRIFDGLLYYCNYYVKYNITTTNTTIII
jgi:hypothetical protein